MSTSSRADWSVVPCLGGSPMYIASKRQLWPVLRVVASSSRIGTGALRLAFSTSGSNLPWWPFGSISRSRMRMRPFAFGRLPHAGE